MSPVFISTLQTAEGRFPAHRSSSRSAPDAIKSRLFSHRSTPRSSAKAPVSGLRPPPRKAAPEVQNFLHLLVQHRGPRATSTHLPRSCSQHPLEFAHCESFRFLGVASASMPDGRRKRHRFQVSFRWMDHCIFWRLGFRQSSFRHVARVPQRIAPYTWTRSLVGCHAAFPLTFRRQVRHQTQKHPAKFLPAAQGIR